jgi:OOP family OmpA-OmpF porin
MRSLSCRVAAVAFLLVAATGPADACMLPTAQYFGPGSHAVDARAERAIATVASWFQRNADGLEAIRIIGHSDRTGSGNSRLAISLARAEAIRDKLVSYGVPPRYIFVQAAGDFAPAVATAEGVSEPDNRRTEILIRMTDAWIAEQQLRPRTQTGALTTC